VADVFKQFLSQSYSANRLHDLIDVMAVRRMAAKFLFVVLRSAVINFPARSFIIGPSFIWCLAF
jgi:hypothetical protein